ncbi:MAG: phage tail tape measure protein, partial [Candidatus Woesearchaeota archaeon]|nr:phage tail tape measure protein [Candidatus Woesearchaeota archaeon]
MASGETNLEFKIKVGGLNELGQLRASVLKLKAGTVEVKDASMQLANAFPKLEGTAKDLQKIYFGQATTMKMLVRNNKVFRNEIRTQVGGLKTARKETDLGSKAWRTYTKQIVLARKQMTGLPFRKVGTDLRNVTNLMLKKAKDLQWVGRQMIVGITAPLGIMLRSSMQAFEAFEKQFVRTKKILGLTGDAEETLRKRMHDLSTQLGVSRSIVAGLTSDFAQMGKKMLGGGDDLAHTASMYAELTLKLEHVGQVSAEVGRDFVANIAGIIGDTEKATGEVDEFGNAIMEVVPKIDVVRGMLAKFNVVENTTALSLRDLAEAFPQVSPAAKAAGIELVFLSGIIGGMRQSGLNATESAHALKFALQRMVNPTAKVVALSEQLGQSIGSEFHKDLGIGNMMLFKLSENMELIAREASDEQALVYLGELVGKRQASRIYATTLALGSFADNVAEVGNIFSEIGRVDVGAQIANTINDEELKAQFANIFDTEESIDSFLLDVHKMEREMKKIADVEGLEKTDMLDAEQQAQALTAAMADLNTTELTGQERSKALNVALQDLSPPMKAMVIDFMGASSAGKQFTEEFNAVMGGPAMMMQKVRTDIKNLLLEIGAEFFDTIQGIIPKIRGWIQALQETSPATKRMVLAVGLLAAALGPLAFIFGQASVGISSIGRVAAAIMPKMKDLTRSLMLSKAMAGQNLPAFRRFGTGLVQVSGKVKSAGKNIRDTFAAIRSDPSVMQSGFHDFQTASKNVLSGGGAAGAAGA